MVLNGVKMKVRDWYRNKYPFDEVGTFINPEVTFGELWDCLKSRKDFYDCCGAYDSLVRERLFEKMTDIFKVSYEFIYGMWITSHG